MKRYFLTAAIVACVFTIPITAFALYSVSDKGLWPESWPKELEPLREKSQTFIGPILDNQHYVIAFKKREDFEAAWPHILKVKSEGSSIELKSSSFFLGEGNAGVCVHAPPKKDGRSGAGVTRIELVVDGKIVDLNRIALPPDTPIIDNRFK